MKRALVLKKETLTPLGTDELAAVAGGGTVTEFTCTASVTFCTLCVVATIHSPCGTL